MYGFGYTPKTVFALVVTTASATGGATVTVDVTVVPHPSCWFGMVALVWTTLLANNEPSKCPVQMLWFPSLLGERRRRLVGERDRKRERKREKV